MLFKLPMHCDHKRHFNPPKTQEGCSPQRHPNAMPNSLHLPGIFTLNQIMHTEHWAADTRDAEDILPTEVVHHHHHHPLLFQFAERHLSTDPAAWVHHPSLVALVWALAACGAVAEVVCSGG